MAAYLSPRLWWSGLAGWIGRSLGDLGGMPPLLFLVAVTATVVMLTELASNTATVAALLPIVGTIAAASGMDLVPLAATIAIAASCAFMLPVATPPNALVTGTETRSPRTGWLPPGSVTPI